MFLNQYSVIMETIEFKKIRKDIGWSMSRLGLYLGVCSRTVFRIENDETKIKPFVRIRMEELKTKIEGLRPLE